MPRPHTPHEAIVQSSAGPAYLGRAGQTRTERVHLVAKDGSTGALDVYRVINAETHPELKARALAGQLHRLEDGRELAIPFVYHDPQSRKLALVLPASLAHLEMKEWARLMAEIADDTQHAVPAYVRDCVTVVGLGALETFLESGVEPDDSELSEVGDAAAAGVTAAQRDRALAVHERSLAERERLLVEREREVHEQEQSLIRLAGDLTSREAALLRREEQLATARADVELREAELSDRPRTGAHPSHAHDADVVPDGEWQEVKVRDVASLPPATRRQGGEEPTVVAALSRISASSAFFEPGRPVEPSTAPPPPFAPAPPPLPYAPPALRNVSSLPPAPASTWHAPRKEPPPLHARAEHADGGGNNDLTVMRAGPSDAQLSAAAPPLPAREPSGLHDLQGAHASTHTHAGRGAHPPPLSPLASYDLEALHGALGDAPERVLALRELARRGDSSSIAVVFDLLDTLPTEHLVPAIACLASFGERAVEALIAGLGSPNPHVRQGVAVALGRLKLRRGLAPLLEQLESEPTAVWQELARAIGDFGLAALRTLSRSVRTSGRRERLMIALAHLANHGCLQDLENMEKDHDPVLSLAAKQALARRSRLHWEDQVVRRGGTMADQTAEARFSQALYAALEGLPAG